jgi:hypothetical protein
MLSASSKTELQTFHVARVVFVIPSPKGLISNEPICHQQLATDNKSEALIMPEPFANNVIPPSETRHQKSRIPPNNTVGLFALPDRFA